MASPVTTTGTGASGHVRAQLPRTVRLVVDYSHGQRYDPTYYMDEHLWDNLMLMGFEVILATGGLNETILEGADALMIASVVQEQDMFSVAEVAAVQSWFSEGNKFLWVACDCELSGEHVTNTSNVVLAAVGSHVYGEIAAVADPVHNVDASYRVLVSDADRDPRVFAMVAPLTLPSAQVVMHSPTLVYGSDSTDPAPDVDPVPLESQSVDGVYPLLYYSANATVLDATPPPSRAHSDGQTGPLVAMTAEFGAGASGTGVIVVSGNSPYGDFMPMCSEEYRGVALNGLALVRQVVYFGVLNALDPDPPVITGPDDLAVPYGSTGNTILWTLTDELPGGYELFRNGTHVLSGPCTSQVFNLSVDLDGLDLGTYNFTLVVCDFVGHTSVDTVIVEVYYDPAYADTTPPSVSQPDNVTVAVNTSASVVWDVSDDHPALYAVYVDGEILIAGQWNATMDTVEFQLEGLDVGLHNVTLVVVDLAGNRASSTVWVSVVESTAPDLVSLLVQQLPLIITAVCDVTVVAFGALTVRARRRSQVAPSAVPQSGSDTPLGESGEGTPPVAE